MIREPERSEGYVAGTRTLQSSDRTRMYQSVTIAPEMKAAFLTSLDEATYEAAPAPSKDELRQARERAAEDLRLASRAPKRFKVDPKLRFR